MTVLVGYVPSPEGEAALPAGVAEARTRGETPLVMNTSRGDAYVDRGFAQQKDLAHVRRDLTEQGVGFDIRQVIGGRDAAEEIVEPAGSPEISLVAHRGRHPGAPRVAQAVNDPVRRVARRQARCGGAVRGGWGLLS